MSTTGKADLSMSIVEGFGLERVERKTARGGTRGEKRREQSLADGEDDNPVTTVFPPRFRKGGIHADPACFLLKLMEPHLTSHSASLRIFTNHCLLIRHFTSAYLGE